MVDIHNNSKYSIRDCGHTNWRHSPFSNYFFFSLSQRQWYIFTDVECCDGFNCWMKNRLQWQQPQWAHNNNNNYHHSIQKHVAHVSIKLWWSLHFRQFPMLFLSRLLLLLLSWNAYVCVYVYESGDFKTFFSVGLKIRNPQSYNCLSLDLTDYSVIIALSTVTRNT